MQQFLNPTSTSRFIWEVLGMVFMFYDAISFPLEVFRPPYKGFKNKMDFAGIIYWTLDFMFNLFTAFHEKGVLVVNWRRTARHYLRTWFCIDLPLVMVDWITFVFLKLAVDTSSLARLLRTMRTVRALRLIRLLKMRQRLSALNDRIDSEYNSIIADELKFVVFILTINHFIACAWYWIGDTSGDANWIAQHDILHEPFQYRYTTALHWSLTQFTPASMDVQPHNTSERIFTIAVVIFALITFSSLVSSITNSMTKLRSISSENSKQLWLLRRYLRERGVNTSLNLHVQRYLEYVMQTRSKLLQEKDVAFLELLSEPLRDRLRWEISSPHLVVHPLFDELSRGQTVLPHHLCRATLFTESFARRDTLFSSGQAAKKMLFIIRGHGLYKATRRSFEESGLQKVHDNDWVSEAALWVHWLHVGDLSAGMECEVISILVAEFSVVVSHYPAMFVALMKYASLFAASLNVNDDPWHETDLHSELSLITIRALRRANVIPEPKRDASRSGGSILRTGDWKQRRLGSIRAMMEMANKMR
eukprot:gnl/TRDRNA2_/TRDRNA2_32338_c0_seq1.p1 gnl/TRDRNA2_/TRDRNA2_32338_c0~~gnl/TRDRNA2_/TRDRNA2_32338_c0_seq1.p1  ORF type:complete len:533 (+),score=50.35 gnl/TRDRNA2_/TRDRNA2_32338_c0_seq1:85-1683(+)